MFKQLSFTQYFFLLLCDIASSRLVYTSKHNTYISIKVCIKIKQAILIRNRNRNDSITKGNISNLYVIRILRVHIFYQYPT